MPYSTALTSMYFSPDMMLRLDCESKSRSGSAHDRLEGTSGGCTHM